MIRQSPPRHGQVHDRVTGLRDRLPVAGDLHDDLDGLDNTHIHREIFGYEDGSL